jgi:hypothetical protein
VHGQLVISTIRVASFFLRVHTTAMFCFLSIAHFLDLTYVIYFIPPHFMAFTLWIFASMHNDNLYLLFTLRTTLLLCHTNGVKREAGEQIRQFTCFSTVSDFAMDFHLVEIFCRMAGTFKLMDECVSYCISFKC